MSFHIHFYGCIDGDDSDIHSRVTSHYVIDQSMISICNMKKNAWEVKPRDSTYILMRIKFKFTIAMKAKSRRYLLFSPTSIFVCQMSGKDLRKNRKNLEYIINSSNKNKSMKLKVYNIGI